MVQERENSLLGDYLLLSLLGRGAVGDTYLAEHRFTRRIYALKLLPQELATNQGFIKRFEEEVKHLALLDHPHLVKIHTVSQAQGVYFLVTDAIVNEKRESLSLADYIASRTRRLDEELLYHILSQLAEALEYAHGVLLQEKPAIHRNIKLNNVLVRQGEGQDVQVYLSDFGLSRIVGVGAFVTQVFREVAESLPKEGVFARYPTSPLDREQQMELHRAFSQSYAFLAPEQKRLERVDRVTPAADCYAFGVLAYFLLTGELPEVTYPFPTLKTEGLHWNWDHLVHCCLHPNPMQRPLHLKKLLESIRHPVVAPAPYLVTPPVRPIIAPAAALLPALAPAASLVSSLPEVGIESEKPVPAVSQLAPVIRPAPLVRPSVDLDPARSFQVDSSITPYTPQNGDTRPIEPLQSQMAVIQGGNYFRGSSTGNRDEMPCHQVTLSSFAFDIHPVTNEQFVRFLEAMGGEKDGQHRDLIRLRDSRIKRSGGRVSIESGYQKHPVVGVTWYGASLYASWVGKRLPTEAEWEVAASGAGEGWLYATGRDIEKNQANFFSSDTTPVMSYPPNHLGLYDMAGNVYEWCYDWYAYNYYEVSVQEPENPKGPLQGVYRVLRGGCWKSLKEDLRCARRHRNNPGTVNSTYGFRCAADVEEIET